MIANVRRRAPRPLGVLAAAAATALLLAGCGGGSSSPSAGDGGSTGSDSGPSSGSSGSSGGSGGSTPSTAAGVSLTPQGTALTLGQTARVTWQPQGKGTSVAAITVTKLQKMSISAFSDWRLDKKTQHSTPYFVHATIRNLGNTDLSGTVVPLYLLDQSNTLLQPSSFQASYPPCPSQPLPPKFKHGKTARVCLVYFILHHGTLQAISFRPTGDFDAITWKGHVGSGH
ncbi:MAG: hypothetical protein QM747_04185 [Nocardioides sp.]